MIKAYYYEFCTWSQPKSSFGKKRLLDIIGPNCLKLARQKFYQLYSLKHFFQSGYNIPD